MTRVDPGLDCAQGSGLPPHARQATGRRSPLVCYKPGRKGGDRRRRRATACNSSNKVVVVGHCMTRAGVERQRAWQEPGCGGPDGGSSCVLLGVIKGALPAGGWLVRERGTRQARRRPGVCRRVAWSRRGAQGRRAGRRRAPARAGLRSDREQHGLERRQPCARPTFTSGERKELSGDTAHATALRAHYSEVHRPRGQGGSRTNLPRGL